VRHRIRKTAWIERGWRSKAGIGESEREEGEEGRGKERKRKVREEKRGGGRRNRVLWSLGGRKVRVMCVGRGGGK